MMKLTKLTAIVMFSTMLTACGGNGFEGTYEISMDAGNDAINKMAIQMMGGRNGQLIIGSDYTESNGQRTEFDEISVRKSGEVSYLVFKSKAGEEALKIIDDETLEKQTPVMAIRFKKI
ncbi:hypothetical protein [Aeromonas sobria]|jgi:hypothetical protein|uniref:hypothetical protein n=1 Tax=Aeromonas sobria TaxID=646 RepID=UPI00195FAE63|nr:hypothetical protein [Aeromonas sobria]